MITTRSAGQPSRCASCARAYCRSRDLRFSSTCCGEDCRTYTIASRSRCRPRIFDVDLSPKGVFAVAPSSRSRTPASRDFIAHLRVVSRRVDLSGHDAAEDRQRSLALFVRQATPEVVDLRRPDGRVARGGARPATVLDIGYLLARLDAGFEPNPPAVAGRPARL